MILQNRTRLDTAHLESMMLRHVRGWPHTQLTVNVRYSRSAPFSGACYYDTARLFINLGEHVRYPYNIPTRIAKAQTRGQAWFRQIYFLRIDEPCHLVLFVFLHEIYHWLVKQAGRNLRQKEAMCDRFAAGILVDQYGAKVVDKNGQIVPRDQWDWQDVVGFVRHAAIHMPFAVDVEGGGDAHPKVIYPEGS